MASIKEVLASSELFNGLTDEELEKVAALSREETYAAGLSVFDESTTAKELYIVAEGKISMEMRLPVYPGLEQDTLTEIIPPGGSCGWSAVVGSRVYIMTARAVEPVRVIAIDGERLLALFNKNHEIGFKVMECVVQVASSRVRSIKRALLA